MRKTRSGRPSSQNDKELSEFISFLRDQNARSYGEVGARHGDTFYAVMTEAKMRRGCALDLPGALWGQDSSVVSLIDATLQLRKEGKTATYVLGDSKDRVAQEMFLKYGPYDCVLIDGDHTLDGVTADWINFRASARLVAFHDIVGHGQKEKKFGREVEVPEFWKTIKQQGYVTREFVDEGSKMGIGVVLMTEERKR